MTDAEAILRLIEESQNFEPFPGLEEWERGYRAGLKTAERVARAYHESRLARAARLSDAADEYYTEAESRIMWGNR